MFVHCELFFHSYIFLTTQAQERGWCWPLRSEAKKALSRPGSIWGVASGPREVILSFYPAQRSPHLQYWVQSWASQYKTDAGTLERVHLKAAKLMKGLEHLPVWECWGLFSLETRGVGGISSVSVNTWREGARKREPGTVQWCPSTGPKAVGTNWNTQEVPLHIRKYFLYLIVVECCHRLSGMVVESLSSEIFKSLNTVLGILLVGKGDWMRWPSEVSSNLNSSVITRVHFAVSETEPLNKERFVVLFLFAATKQKKVWSDIFPRKITHLFFLSTSIF